MKLILNFKNKTNKFNSPSKIFKERILKKSKLLDGELKLLSFISQEKKLKLIKQVKRLLKLRVYKSFHQFDKQNLEGTLKK